MDLQKELMELGISVRKFAEEIGRKEQQVGRWVNGRTKPNIQSEKLIRDKLKELKDK